MGIAIAREAYAKILAAARKAGSMEACGLLGGAKGRVSAFYELNNAAASNEQYRILPDEQLAAVKDMRKKGLEMLASWHSHPDTPARMSPEDLRLAYTSGLVHVIVSMMDADNPDVRAYVVEDGRAVGIELKIGFSAESKGR